MRHVLYFEPVLGNGHRPVFLSNIVQRLRRGDYPIKLTVATTKAPAADRAPWWEEAASGGCRHVQVLTLPSHLAAHCVTGPYIWRGYRQALIADDIARKLSCTLIFFAWLDHALVGTALGNLDTPCGGILFRSADGAVGGPPSAVMPRRWLHHRFRDALLFRSIQRRQLRFAMSVDSLFVERMKRRPVVAERISFLKDAYQAVEERPEKSGMLDELLRSTDTGQRWQDKRTYLCAGGIDERKNVVRCVEACVLLPQEDRRRIRLLIAGKIARSYRKPVLDAVAKARARAPELEVCVLDRVLNDSEFHAIVRSADVILVTYGPGFLGSSGNLVQAIAAGKPVLGPASGMLGQQVASYRLGLTADTLHAQSIARVIKLDLVSPMRLSHKAASNFLAGRSPDEFGTTVLDRLADSLSEIRSDVQPKPSHASVT